MDWLKLNNEGEIEFVSEEIKLVPELQEMFTLKYNKGPKDADGRKKFRFLNELKYLYLMYSLKSPYNDYTSEDRHRDSLVDAGLPPDWKPSPEFKALLEKYQKGTLNKVTRSLKVVEGFLEKFEKHLEDIKLDERNGNGGLVHDPGKIMTTLKQLPDYLMTLQELERQARHDIIRTPTSKGDHELGWMAVNDQSKKGRKNEKESVEESDN